MAPVSKSQNQTPDLTTTATTTVVPDSCIEDVEKTLEELRQVKREHLATLEREDGGVFAVTSGRSDAGITNVNKVLHGPLPKGKRSTKPWESAGRGGEAFGKLHILKPKVLTAMEKEWATSCDRVWSKGHKWKPGDGTGGYFSAKKVALPPAEEERRRRFHDELEKRLEKNDKVREETQKTQKQIDQSLPGWHYTPAGGYFTYERALSLQQGEPTFLAKESMKFLPSPNVQATIHEQLK